ncbi:MAG: acyl-CoA thioesterase [Deltaproteobacteria bacterium]|nr:acyl-CoA thioesterase [Deltaproteobacteria bacterium]
MRPKPFIPKELDNEARYVKNQTDSLIWHRCRNRTLYADTDRSQIVYHANYLRYFELGRASLMRDTAYPYKEVEENGFIYPIIEIGIQYYTPLYYDDPMIIYTRPSDLERVKLKFDYTITHGETGEIVCIGFTRHCAINSSGTPVGIDEKTVHLWQIFPK